ncbi:MAG: TlpA family protein disulfide reductase [Deltaproteobacteria bacterium]|nr:TlpA family protein disulfide reductase [Deltaproteobacteria bacterium]
MLLSLLLACPSSDKPSAPPLSRVDAVAAAPKKAVDVGAFCEDRSGKAFALPQTEAPADNPAGWTWVNVWATWCKPCVEEMPMIVRWQEKLKAAGTDVALQFLSVDAKAEDVATWRAAHPEIPAGPRIADVKLLSPWLGTIGLDASAVLPVHLFVDPSDTIRCVRMGSIAEHDYDAVSAVLSGK